MIINQKRSYNIQTLEDMLKEIGHLNEKNMILKIDVEVAEWNSFKDLSELTLLQFKYLVFEYHFFKNDLLLYFNVLKKYIKHIKYFMFIVVHF